MPSEKEVAAEVSRTEQDLRKHNEMKRKQEEKNAK